MPDQHPHAAPPKPVKDQPGRKQDRKVDESSVEFGCSCSDVRVLGALSTLGRADIEDIIRGQTVIDLSCDYCGKSYPISSERLRGLLDES